MNSIPKRSKSCSVPRLTSKSLRHRPRKNECLFTRTSISSRWLPDTLNPPRPAKQPFSSYSSAAYRESGLPDRGRTPTGSRISAELRFTGEQIDYLRTLPNFRNASAAGSGSICGFRFTGDSSQMPEGTPFFPAEPIAISALPCIEAQIPETYFLAALGHQSMIAAKALADGAAAWGRGYRRVRDSPRSRAGSRCAHRPSCCTSRVAKGPATSEAVSVLACPYSALGAHSWVLSLSEIGIVSRVAGIAWKERSI